MVEQHAWSGMEEIQHFFWKQPRNASFIRRKYGEKKGAKEKRTIL